MAGETILVIDADIHQDIDERIAAALEAKGYLVFTGLSRVLNAETLEKLSPSLIYIQPSTLDTAGLEPCKTIHAIPALKKVPIVLLASLRELSDPRYLTVYGIVDYLKLTFSPEELIQKTETIMAKTRASNGDKQYEWETEESTPPSKPTHHDKAAEDDMSLSEEEFSELTTSGKRVPVAATEEWNDEEEEIEERERPPKPPPSPKTVRKVKKRSSSLFRPLIGALILLVIAGAGFLAYNHFMASPKVETVRPVKVTTPAPPKARPKPSQPQASPQSKTADTSAPSSPAPTSAPTASSPAPASPAPTLAPTASAAAPSQAPASSTSKSQVTTPRAPAPPAPSTPPVQKSSLPVATASQAAHKPFCSVQLGAYKDEANAQALVTQLRQKGYDAFTQPGVAKDKSPIYRVLVGKYEDKEAARKQAREIASKERLKTVVYAE